MERPLIGILLDRLRDAGLRHVFGICGDYALTLFKALEDSPSIDLINTCDEQGAGFAADGYARVHGLGAVAVTYGVGALKLVNTTAQAYAERSPVVVISGAPGISEREGDPLLHHRVKDFDSQLRIFEEITTAQAVLEDPRRCDEELQRVLAVAQRTNRPIYIEIPRDMLAVPCPTLSSVSPIGSPRRISSPAGGSDEDMKIEALGEAMEEVEGMLNAAISPIVIVGLEVHRLGLQKQVAKFIRHANIPFATTVLAKSVLSECEPGFIGIYSGGMSLESVREKVEGSDCLVLLGCMSTDLNTGIFTSRINRKRTISSTIETLRVQAHQYTCVGPKAFLNALLSLPLRARPALPRRDVLTSVAFHAVADEPVTVARLFSCLNTRLSEKLAIIADPGDALFGATDLIVRGAPFISCAYYASLGFAVPASLGVQLACPQWRPLVLVGDGSFQMTGMELSSCARYGIHPIVIVLDNNGYGTERPMLDGEFNDVRPWKVTAVLGVIGSGNGVEVKTEGEFAIAIDMAIKTTEEIFLIHVHLQRDDISEPLARLTANLKLRV